jgi:hypothetical protein
MDLPATRNLFPQIPAVFARGPGILSQASEQRLNRCARIALQHQIGMSVLAKRFEVGIDLDDSLAMDKITMMARPLIQTGAHDQQDVARSKT